MRQSNRISLDQKGEANTRTMKRKRSAELTGHEFVQRQPDTSTASIARSNPLCAMLREYGMLEAVVSNLCADDLLALALTAKALHEAVMPRLVSLENLLCRVRCSGKGVDIRNRCHLKSNFFYDCDCTEYVQCGSSTTNRSVETKPCATCKVATCDECRVHCVYQSIFQAPDDPDDEAELPNFSGFVFLQPYEQGILSPHHLDLAESSPRWQDPSIGQVAPYHDQGYLDAPLLYNAPAPAEYIKEVLDFDLGQQSLNSISEDSRYGCPPPVLSSLCEVTEARKIIVCDTCFQHSALKSPTAMKTESEPMPTLPWLPQKVGHPPLSPCQCTLRKRFLDRWLCLRCYENEEKTIQASTGPCSWETMGVCRCGKDACHVLCLWCWGEVADEDEDIDDAIDYINSFE